MPDQRKKELLGRVTRLEQEVEALNRFADRVARDAARTMPTRIETGTGDPNLAMQVRSHEVTLQAVLAMIDHLLDDVKKLKGETG